MSTCDAHHDGHDCTRPGECIKATIAMCERITNRDRGERARPIDHGHPMTITPDEWRERNPR